MRWIPLAAAALGAVAAACGEVKERPGCASSAGCPPGEYCARTTEGNVCWPDAVPPEVGAVTVACGTAACPRDGTLIVTATAADDQELLAAEATVDLDPDRVFPLARTSGDGWSGTIDLATVPFPAFASELVITVRARDGARNEASAVAGAGQRPMVTRVRWAMPLDASVVIPTPPAVDGEGVVVVGGSDGKLRFFAADGGVAHPALALAASAISQPPSIGAQAIWVGANDGKLYAVAPDGSAELPSRSCAASGVAKGPPAILTTAGVDVAFGAFSNGRIYASGPTCVPTAAVDASTTGAAVSESGAIFGVTGSGLDATLHRFGWDGATFTAGWDLAVGGEVVAPIAFDGSGAVLTASKDKKIVTTTPAGVAAPLATLSGSIADSPVVLSNGDIVAGDASGMLHRFTSSGSPVWSPPVDLGAAVHAPMVLSGGSVRFLVATADGTVHALDDLGTILWQGALTAGMALGAGNLHTPPGSAFSTAYFGGADGKLYAVIVEGGLDTSAPWPKAWHDARNTSRAGGGF